MAHKSARTLFLSLVVLLCFVLLDSPGPGRAFCAVLPVDRASPTKRAGEVFVLGEMPEEDLIAVTSAIAAGAPQAAILFDTETSSAANKAFLAAYRPRCVTPVGSFSAGILELERQLNVKIAAIPSWNNKQPIGLWKELLPTADCAVVCPARPRSLLLQAACLAGIQHAPLWIVRGVSERPDDLGRQLAQWHARTIYAVGTAKELCRQVGAAHVVCLADQQAVFTTSIRDQRKSGTIENLVITNPADSHQGLAAMSCLAPWLAIERHAAMLLTDQAGKNVPSLVSAALKKSALDQVESMILLADLQAIPMERRPNPVAGKDTNIEMEPLTPTDAEPFTFAIGRLFHEDRGVVALMLARQRLLQQDRAPRKALVVSNPTGGLPLLEAFSKNTAKELLNSGYRTTSFLGEEVDRADLRRLLPEQDIFLWEGHFSTMVKQYRLQEWTEPLRPALIFLQSCLALSESKAQPFLERGAVGVLGSSTRTYSGSGGACSLAFFDALLYEGRSVGAALRQSKNFLVAYSQLKEKRLGADARLAGANLRSAWAMSLWGDPTLKLPPPKLPPDALPHIHHEVRGNTIVISLPTEAHEKALTTKYKAQMLPNGRLAGLLTKELDEGKQRLVPFIFAEVHLADAPASCTPRLTSSVPASHWVFCWDARRSCGYLLITPRAKDRDEVRFHVVWRSEQMVRRKQMRRQG